MRMNSTEIAYIAGLLDGEGCFYSRLVNPKKGHKTVGGVDVRITVQACSMAMIEALKDFYDSLGISYGLQLGRMQNLSKRPAHKIDVNRKKHVLLLLETVRPYLRVKLAEANLILEFLYRHGIDQRKKRVSDENKILFIENLRDLKKIA